MNESELLRDFLNGFPASLHPLDMRRFVAYALACAENNHSFDMASLREAGLDDSCIEVYESAFSWIREAYDCLREQGRIVL